MNQLCKLTEIGVGLEPSPGECTGERNAARAVVLDATGSVALLYVASDNYYKLPGGGMEAGESVEEALRREVLEETGASIAILGEVGHIVERRNAFGLIQHSYCFLTRVTGEPVQPSFTAEEIADGFSAEWVTPAEALELIRHSVPQSYHGRFVQVRDQVFLIKAIEMLGIRK